MIDIGLCGLHFSHDLVWSSYNIIIFSSTHAMQWWSTPHWTKRSWVRAASPHICVGVRLASQRPLPRPHPSVGASKHWVRPFFFTEEIWRVQHCIDHAYIVRMPDSRRVIFFPHRVTSCVYAYWSLNGELAGHLHMALDQYMHEVKVQVSRSYKKYKLWLFLYVV